MIKSAVLNAMSGMAAYFRELYDVFSESSDKLLATMVDLLDVSAKYSNAVTRVYDTGAIRDGGIDYALLAAYLAEEFRKAPVQHDVSVEMKDGDVYLDNERVGRKVAPVVSRVIAKG